MDILADGGESVAMLHFAQVWPIDSDAARSALCEAKKVTCVEGNALGQFASLLKEAGVLETCGLMTRYDGLPFQGRQIAEEVSR